MDSFPVSPLSQVHLVCLPVCTLLLTSIIGLLCMYLLLFLLRCSLKMGTAYVISVSLLQTIRTGLQNVIIITSPAGLQAAIVCDSNPYSSLLVSLLLLYIKMQVSIFLPLKTSRWSTSHCGFLGPAPSGLALLL